MTNEQQRKILESAAKSCGLTYKLSEHNETCFIRHDASVGWHEWNPLINPLDTAEMCAMLSINTYFNNVLGIANCYLVEDFLNCIDAPYKDYDNSRLKAWMYAATLVAAKIGGYEE